MAYNYTALFENIIAAVGGTGSFTQRMNGLIAHCESQMPNKAWRAFQEIDFEADSDVLECWLPTAWTKADASASYKGLWFGLNNPIVSAKPTADIYVAASPTFDRGTFHWAAGATFYPDNGYLNSSVLKTIYRLAYSGKESLGNNAEYPLVLAYGAMAARLALEATEPSAPFTHLSGAAVGFDSGDLLFIGSFSDGRFCANVTAG